MAAVIECPSCALQFPARPSPGGLSQRCPRCGTAVGGTGEIPASSQAVKHRSPASEFRCTECRGTFDLDQVYDEGNGGVICHGCYDRRDAAVGRELEGEAPPAVAATPPGWEWDTGVAAHPPRVNTPGGRPRKSGSSSKGWAVAAGALVAAAAVAVTVFMMRPAPPTGQPGVDASGVAAATGPESNLDRVNRLGREARDRTKQRDHAGAAARYAEMFKAIEGDPAIAGNRSLMADLTPARKEWQLANDAAGLPPLPKDPATLKAAPQRTRTPDRGRTADAAAPRRAGAAPGPEGSDEAGVPPAKGGQRNAQRADAGVRRGGKDVATPRPSPSRAVTKQRPAAGPARAAPADKSQVASLLDAAERLAAAGDKPAALARYSEALRAAGDRSEIDDTALRQRLARAVTTRAELIGQLRGGEGMRKLTLDSLMEAGARAMAAEKWEAALESLADARQLVEKRTKVPAERVEDPHYIPALHGMAVAYLKLNRNPKAGALFDESAPLGRASLSTRDHELAWNRAVIDMIQTVRIMRAVKGLKEYFERNPGVASEGLLNVFGTAMSEAAKQFEEEDKAFPAVLIAAKAVYDRQEQQLEASRPGQKRWGTRWIGADEFSRNMEASRAVELEVRRIRETDLRAATRALAVAKRGRRVRIKGLWRTIVDERAVRAARDQTRQIREHIKRTWAQVPPRQWLDSYDPVVPSIGPQTVVASAGGVASSPANATGAADDPGNAAPPFSPDPEPAPAEPESAVADATPTPEAPKSPRAGAAGGRRVQRYAAAFPVDRLRLITAAAPLGAATSVFLEDSQGAGMRARVVARNEQLALLEVDPQSANGGMAFLNLSDGFVGGALRCAGLTEQGIFMAPPAEMIEGRARAPGDAGWTVSLPVHPRLAGAPLLDAMNGKLVGVVVAARDDPETQLPAVGIAAVRAFLTESDALPAAACANPDPTAVYQVTIEE